MNNTPEEPSLRKLFSEQARRDHATASSFEHTLRAPEPAPRLSFARLAIAASLLLVAGTLITLALRNQTTPPQKPAQQIVLPNLLEGLDAPAENTWKSPTAFLLDLSTTTANTNTGTSPENPSQTRQSNG